MQKSPQDLCRHLKEARIGDRLFHKARKVLPREYSVSSSFLKHRRSATQVGIIDRSRTAAPLLKTKWTSAILLSRGDCFHSCRQMCGKSPYLKQRLWLTIAFMIGLNSGAVAYRTKLA